MTDNTRAIPRSILYTPALSLNRVVKALTYDADVHLIDLEDSVPGPSKAQGRIICRTALDNAPLSANIAVRINALGTVDALHDLVMLCGGGTAPGFIVMSMVRSPAEVVFLRETFASAGKSPEIYLTIETVEAITDLDDVAAVADGLIFGSADLAATLGVPITWSGMLAARQAMVLASARHGIGCIDTANYRLSEPEVLANEIQNIRDLGFHGKATVHPSELEPINSALRPNEGALLAARRITEAVKAAQGGIALLDGHMVGPPFARMAHTTLGLGQAWAARFNRSNS
ncbi:(3S)-malyl-CoA thioesterase [Serratia quinivorans]|jgi:citrate lyase subunit beta/citryl-CoA lyase/(S)-citramalyl-CoA lyase|uniref:HpcH/HpaI aldolase/citrate lyase family protein n=1 Tax=Serratia quinivorans TaxID=137545 RepID=UPI00217B9CC3|nr:CoA ester lyase [Serratia quinivorans]CAI0743576.1 (3S)-malyl-CoA thioesterase [Serratia quinivorans]CAI0763434.1 (3S)-malyl-CoA thioesterase [Serratia quinivorans]CAI1555467.1 (3S)-malyl-CoA thioesterase [Serratia quinivorans]CAI2047792.1 (3S)-malyl-CoA thioesterase [Serratia quinivorans]CAI2412074.1 (3S)-malyl-CoA thioesterase [Serratia quinivorans]